MEQFYSESPNFLPILQSSNYKPCKVLQGSVRSDPLFSCWPGCSALTSFLTPRQLAMPESSPVPHILQGAAVSKPSHWLFPLHRMLHYQTSARFTPSYPSILFFSVIWGWRWLLLPPNLSHLALFHPLHGIYHFSDCYVIYLFCLFFAFCLYSQKCKSHKADFLVACWWMNSHNRE